MQGNGAAPAGAMALGPTPAGHQAELNIIYNMVEELSRQLADNRRMTEDIVSGLGRVRNRARERNLGNDELLGEIADEVLSQEPNLEAMLSILTESLDRAKMSRDANFALLLTYAKVFESILRQFSIYKQKHITDVSAWHRSYRTQLAEARAENCRLREQIWGMQEHAKRANDLVRDFSRKVEENEARWDSRVREKALRQEVRFWKRMAMPAVDDNDEMWSDDDDIIDSAEKERLKRVEREVAVLGLESAPSSSDEIGEGSESGGAQPTTQQVPTQQAPTQQTYSLPGLMGGVAMERDRDAGTTMAPPSRPPSTGSTGRGAD
ncbi:hypothetical protein F5Y17DRAFT_450012 [Xylariaceae sp. FL0594]|nr:hypothetical protein F5Y17DRAFT_450012 [Xylariaceae sp. FL0594]